MRRAARTDANQAEIVAALRQIGVSVAVTSHCGNGFPDLVCADRGGRTVLLEVKAPGEKLTPDQYRFHASWRAGIPIVHSVDEALDVFFTR